MTLALKGKTFTPIIFDINFVTTFSKFGVKKQIGEKTKNISVK